MSGSGERIKAVTAGGHRLALRLRGRFIRPGRKEFIS